jgi:hypothetical protein
MWCMSSRCPYISPLPNIRSSRILRRIGIRVIKAGKTCQVLTSLYPTVVMLYGQCGAGIARMMQSFLPTTAHEPHIDCDRGWERPVFWICYSSKYQNNKQASKMKKVLGCPGGSLCSSDLASRLFVGPLSAQGEYDVCAWLRPLPQGHVLAVVWHCFCNPLAIQQQTPPAHAPLPLKRPDSSPYVPTSSPAYPKNMSFVQPDDAAYHRSEAVITKRYYTCLCLIRRPANRPLSRNTNAVSPLFYALL